MIITVYLNFAQFSGISSLPKTTFSRVFYPILPPLAQQVLAYTDGACRGNGKVAGGAAGGYGAVIVLPTGEQIDICGGDTATTNNRMELQAVIAALQHTPNDVPLELWADSKYVLDGITQWINGWKAKNWRNVKNVELWQQLDALRRGRQVSWRWVKGHAGQVGNEYADRLANQGIDQLPHTFNKIVHPASTSQPTPHLSPSQPAMMPTSQFTQPTQSNRTADTGSAMTADDWQALNAAYDDLPDGTSGDNHHAALNQPQPPTASPLPVTAAQAADMSAFVDAQGVFVAQDDALQARRPTFDGITNAPNPTFVPLLPIAKNSRRDNRQLILDTETTGTDPQNGDRIVEVGIIELINRRFTGEKLHVYINPQRAMEEAVINVHGIYSEFLDGMPTFAQVGQAIFDFIQGAEVIAHNASFDMNFLQAEFERMGLPSINERVAVVDSLAIAKQMYAGQRNSLDALVKRLDVGKQDRTFHGALLDAEILAEVYLAMTGGQVALAIDEEIGGGTGNHQRFNLPVKRYTANAATEAAHRAWLEMQRGQYDALPEHW